MNLEEIRKLAKEVALEALKAQAKDKENPIREEVAKAGGVPAKDKGIDRSLLVGRMIRLLALNKCDKDRAIFYAKKYWGEDDPVIKALEAGTDTAGGYLVAPEYGASVFEALRATAVVRRMGAVTISVDSGKLNMIGVATGATANYVGENSNITRTEPVFTQIAFTLKKLAAVVPISNDLLRYASYSVDEIVRNDLVAAFATREDLAFIRGDGTNDTPVGILNWVASGNKFNANSTVNIANITADLGQAILKLRSNNVKFIRPGWILSPRVEWYLSTLRDSNGNYAFPEMKEGRLLGYPYAVSQQIPENLGAGTNETEVYLVDFSECFIAEESTIEITTSDTAAYFDGSNVVSAFSLDQTVVKAVARHDFAMRRNVAGSVIQAVTWGAA